MKTTIVGCTLAIAFLMQARTSGPPSTPARPKTAAPSDDEKSRKDPNVFAGTWVNRKMRSSGPLKATLEQGKGDDWKGRFEGTFKNDPFKYDVTFTGTKSDKTGAATEFKGSASVDGDQTQWTGTLKGDVLTVTYRSARGYNGEFTMKRQSDRPPGSNAEKKAPKKPVR